MKKFAKTSGILSLIVSVLTVLFMVSAGVVHAATSKNVDVITDIKIQNAAGGELTEPLDRFNTFSF